MNEQAPLLEMRGITLDYRRQVLFRKSSTRVLDQVDLTIGRGETVGLVGESGSGKTSLARVALGLVAPTDGSVLFDGTDITHHSHRARRALSSRLQAVFQDPYSSLNPTRRVGASIAEPLLNDRTLTREEINSRVSDILARVGLPRDAANRFPAQFSGGQRQRIAIARALVVRPELVICDEAVSALDLSVSAQILNLLAELQETLGVSYLFIAHDLAVVRFLSQRIAVMQAGRIVEVGAAQRVYDAPSHEYTRTLLAAIPNPDPRGAQSPRSGHPSGATRPSGRVIETAVSKPSGGTR
jgi:peptide/nickel transport system ATP-binding protein